jgi:hypothetical protein
MGEAKENLEGRLPEIREHNQDKLQYDLPIEGRNKTITEKLKEAGSAVAGKAYAAVVPKQVPPKLPEKGTDLVEASEPVEGIVEGATMEEARENLEERLPELREKNEDKLEYDYPIEGRNKTLGEKAKEAGVFLGEKAKVGAVYLGGKAKEKAKGAWASHKAKKAGPTEFAETTTTQHTTEVPIQQPALQAPVQPVQPVQQAAFKPEEKVHVQTFSRAIQGGYVAGEVVQGPGYHVAEYEIATKPGEQNQQLPAQQLPAQQPIQQQSQTSQTSQFTQQNDQGLAQGMQNLSLQQKKDI